MTKESQKLNWEGRVMGVQPRIRLHRSFDQRSHSYLGYTLRMRGWLSGKECDYLVAIGKAAQQKSLFRIGDQVIGQGHAVVDRESEICDIYKVSAVKVLRRSIEPLPSPPPYLGVPPLLTVYRERGHRRLRDRTFEAKCTSCLWGCAMPVDITVDQWNPTKIECRVETFCYGPKSCPFYDAGPPRQVPGRQGMVWEEDDAVDANATSHRSMDE
ncbi:MAG TPA: hypothetical protein PKA37_15790 [Planctomycetota bacterium]|nr:hypothetical protein [Planctomycetota bacterium]